MSKIILDSIAGGYNLNKINDNFDTIADTINNQVLFRDNPEGEPNSLQSDIDCNSKNLLNVGDLRVLGSASLNGINFDAVNSAFVWRGAWDSGTTYAVSDGVSYNGSSYIATAVSTNSAPPSANWDVLAGKGDPGDVTGSGTSVVGRVVTFANTSGDLLSDGGILLSALATKGTLASSGITVPALTELASINSGQIAGFRNRIHNGGFQVDQRNRYASQTITAAAALAYTADRWYAYSTGANVTGQVVAGSNQSQKRYQFTGAASVTAIGFGTRLEAADTYDLNNKTVTISADLANSLLTTVTWTLSRATTTDDTFGTLASPTVTQIATGTFTVDSTVTRYNAQVSVPAAATTGLQLVFSVGAQISGTWTIGDVQLEIGSVASTFEKRPYKTELELCQYYCRTYYPGVSRTPRFFGTALTTGESYLLMSFPTMRVQPVLSVTTIGSFVIYNRRTTLSGVATSLNAQSNDANSAAFSLLTTVGAPTLVVGDPVELAVTAGGLITLTADL